MPTGSWTGPSRCPPTTLEDDDVDFMLSALDDVFRAHLS